MLYNYMYVYILFLYIFDKRMFDKLKIFDKAFFTKWVQIFLERTKRVH